MVKKILNAGSVELDQLCGDDQRILKIARVSTGSGSKGADQDRSLLHRLWRDKHTSPFESVFVSFKLTVPIFIARQIMRHRTFSYSEMSARYVEMPSPSFFIPKSWRLQAKKNHQGSSEEVVKDSRVLDWMASESAENSMLNYGEATKRGVARELARIFYPVSMYTTFYMMGNLRNWFHFLALRLDEHAQEEVREVAKAVLDLLKESTQLPYTLEIFQDDLEIEQIILKIKNKYKADLPALKGILEGLLNG